LKWIRIWIARSWIRIHNNAFFAYFLWAQVDTVPVLYHIHDVPVSWLQKRAQGYRYLLAESDCACLEKRDMRMRKMMGSSWNRAENPPCDTHMFVFKYESIKIRFLFCSHKKNYRYPQVHKTEHLETNIPRPGIEPGSPPLQAYTLAKSCRTAYIMAIRNFYICRPEPLRYLHSC
jgi:hypothetical protein